MSAAVKENGQAAVEAPAITVRALGVSGMLVPIIGTTPLIMNRFSEKAKRMMLDAMQGRKAPKQAKDPSAEYRAAMYVDDDGEPGMPSVAFKSSIVEASRFFDRSVTKVLLRQAVFVNGIHSEAAGVPLVKIDSESGPRMREDVTRVGVSGTDLRYRPEFLTWKTVLNISYVSSVLDQGSVLSLIEAAGFGVGVGEWRPERSGDFGQFKIDTDREVANVPVIL